MSDATADVLTPPPATHGAVSITPRNIRFMRPDALPQAATWMGGDVVATAVFNALSLTFPDGERMFMDSVRYYKDVLSGALLEDAKAFIAQEAIHTREHIALNKLMDPAHYPLKRIEDHIREQIAITGKFGPMALLGATISLEHFTALLGDYILRDKTGLLDGAPEELREMWQWHALEETEHKAVAFDVFNAATAKWSGFKRYMLRTRIMAITTIQFTAHITWYASLLLRADGAKPTSAVARVLWYLFGTPGFYRKALRGYWSWYKPGFHPWQHDNSSLLETWRAKFS
jgi:predicted metal-dependent hydrolase